MKIKFLKKVASNNCIHAKFYGTRIFGVNKWGTKTNGHKGLEEDTMTCDVVNRSISRQTSCEGKGMRCGRHATAGMVSTFLLHSVASSEVVTNCSAHSL